MGLFLIKWAVASLFMPALVLFFGKALSNLLVLVFWPGAIVLMSLGAERRPLWDIVYTWGVAISLNVLLYVFIGFSFHYVMKLVKG